MNVVVVESGMAALMGFRGFPHAGIVCLLQVGPDDTSSLVPSGMFV